MDKKEIIDDGQFGEIQCQIAPIGEFYGSDRDGNPVSETLTPESLENLANKLNESGKEILCDKDHASVKSGTDRDTEAQGWFSRFFIDPIKGLMGWLKLTKSGREAIENREYRFLSPVFSLDDKKSPTNLHSVAMTNCAALPVEPILNTEPKDNEMSKEEIIALIRETLAEMKNKEDMDDKDDTEVCNACQKKVENEMPDDDGKKDDTPVDKTEPVADTEKTVDTDTVDKTETSETTDDMKDEEKKETVSNSCQKKKAMNEQTCDGKGEEVKKTKEVIKEEVLNSEPNATAINLEITSEPSWKNKQGDDFWNELRRLGYRV